MSSVEAQTVVPAPLNHPNTIDVALNTLPKEFPAAVSGRAAWTSQYLTSDEWVYTLTPAEVVEIVQGLEAYKGMHKLGHLCE